MKLRGRIQHLSKELFDAELSLTQADHVRTHISSSPYTYVYFLQIYTLDHFVRSITTTLVKHCYERANTTPCRQVHTSDKPSHKSGSSHRRGNVHHPAADADVVGGILCRVYAQHVYLKVFSAYFACEMHELWIEIENRAIV